MAFANINAGADQFSLTSKYTESAKKAFENILNTQNLPRQTYIAINFLLTDSKTWQRLVQGQPISYTEFIGNSIDQFKVIKDAANVLRKFGFEVQIAAPPGGTISVDIWLKASAETKDAISKKIYGGFHPLEIVPPQKKEKISKEPTEFVPKPKEKILSPKEKILSEPKIAPDISVNELKFTKAKRNFPVSNKLDFSKINQPEQKLVLSEPVIPNAEPILGESSGIGYTPYKYTKGREEYTTQKEEQKNVKLSLVKIQTGQRGGDTPADALSRTNFYYVNNDGMQIELEDKKLPTFQAQNISSTIQNSILNLIFPKEKMQTLPNTEFGSFIRSLQSRYTKDITATVGFLTQISSGNVEYTLYNSGFGQANSGEFANNILFLKWAKTGIDGNGRPFLLIDKNAKDEITKHELSHDTEVSFPSYVCTTMPTGGVVLLEGKAENGKWIQTSLINEESLNQIRNIYLSDIHSVQYLLSQSNFGASLNISSRSKKMVSAAGKFESLQASLSDNSLFVPLIYTALDLLSENASKMDSVWIESVPFYSFSKFYSKNHFLVFGKSGDDYFVVDSQSSVRGKGKSEIEAMKDMATSGFCNSGVYYYFDKPYGSEPKGKPVEIVAVPAENSWVYDVSKVLSSTLTAGYLFRHNPYAQIAGVTGSVIRTIQDSVDREDRVFHKGEKFEWKSGDGYFLAADAFFVSGAIIGLSRFSFLSAVPQLKPIATFAGFGGFAILTGFGISEDYKEFNKQIVEEKSNHGKPLSYGSGLLGNLGDTKNNLLNIYSKSVYGKSFSESNEVALVNEVQSNWIRYIESALSSQTPLGLESLEVRAFERAILLGRIDWIEKNWVSIEQMSKLLNWSVSDTVLEVLMFGGPKTENSLSSTLGQINNLTGLGNENFKLSAEYLSNKHSDIFHVNVNRIKEDLELGWIRGELPTSDIKTASYNQIRFLHENK
ncbi:MAG: hypothetical protein WC492_00995 [Candidatus Micrarchaeia archaeon]